MPLEVIAREPDPAARRPVPLLFVHGAWHGAWCWTYGFLDYFAAHSYAAYAVSLRGHGGSPGRLRWARVHQYVADVAEAAAQLPAPPVIIGHSMGGLVAQKYLEAHTAPAGVLLASVPPAGALRTALRFARRRPREFLLANLKLSLYPLVASEALCREALFSAATPPEATREYCRRIQDESYFAFLDMLVFALPRPGRVRAPMLVLGGANDRIFSPDEVTATARAYGTTPVIFPGLAHDLMLEPGWEAVAERMRQWLDQRWP